MDCVRRSRSGELRPEPGDGLPASAGPGLRRTGRWSPCSPATRPSPVRRDRLLPSRPSAPPSQLYRVGYPGQPGEMSAGGKEVEVAKVSQLRMYRIADGK